MTILIWRIKVFFEILCSPTFYIFYFWFEGFINIDTALDLTTYFGQEDSFTVWEVVFNQFRNLYKFMETAEQRDAFTVRNLVLFCTYLSMQICNIY